LENNHKKQLEEQTARTVLAIAFVFYELLEEIEIEYISRLYWRHHQDVNIL